MPLRSFKSISIVIILTQLAKAENLAVPYCLDQNQSEGRFHFPLEEAMADIVVTSAGTTWKPVPTTDQNCEDTGKSELEIGKVRLVTLPNNQFRIEVMGSCGPKKAAVIGGEFITGVFRATSQLTEKLNLSGEASQSYSISPFSFIKVGPELNVFSGQFFTSNPTLLYVTPQLGVNSNAAASTGLELGLQHEKIRFRIQSEMNTASPNLRWNLGISLDW